MTKHSRVAFGITLLVALVTQAVTSTVVGATEPMPAELMTYDGAGGQRYFALSVQPSENLPAITQQEIVVMVDTSASQIGAYRTDSFEAVKQLLADASPNCRVQVAAVDLNLVLMTQGFASPSDALKSIKNLSARTPLGSTDMVTGLESAATLFSNKESIAKQIIYIGDGISRADLLNKQQFSSLTSNLAKQHISVSSYAIGPNRDIHMLVALANQTGGQVFVDASDVSGQQAGQELAKSLLAPVVWLDNQQLHGFGTHFPSNVPPLRQDRDSVVIGKLDAEPTAMPSVVHLKGMSGGQTVELTWQLDVQPSSDDYAFLPRLISMAADDGGASLPTISKHSFAELRNLLVAVHVDSQASVDLDTQTWMVQTEEPLLLIPDEVVPAPSVDSILAPAPEYNAPVFGSSNAVEAPSGLLDEAIESRRVNQEFIKSEVSRGLDQVRRDVRSNPGGAIVELKSLREAVRQAPDLDADMRGQLIDRIDSTLRQANNQKVAKDQSDAAARERLAQDLERNRLRDQMRRKDDLLRTYVEQFNSRMDERRYELATEASIQAFEVAPDLVVTEATLTKAQIATAYERVIALRQQRQQAVLNALYSTDESNMPFNDNEPLVYPDAQVWENLTLSRKKYAQVDYATMDGAEQRIMEELERKTKIDFFDEPLADALTYLEELHGIQIEVNQSKLDEEGITTDTPVNKQAEWYHVEVRSEADAAGSWPDLHR